MKRMLVLLALLPVLGYAQTMNADELPEMCAAAYVMGGEETKLKLWKGMYSLRTDLVMEYLQILQHYEDEDDLPAELLAQAIAECDAIYEATSQAAVVDGIE